MTVISLSDHEETSFSSQRAQPSGPQVRKSHRKALFKDDEVLSVLNDCQRRLIK